MSFLKIKFKNSKLSSEEDQKKNKLRFAVSVLCAASVMLVCAGLFFKTDIKKALGSEDQLFLAFTEELFRRETSSNSINLHYTLKNPENYGIKESPVTFGTFSTDPTEIYASVENIETVLKQFEFQELSVNNQLTYEILEEHLENMKAGGEYLLYEEPLGIVSGVQTQLPVVLSEYQFYRKQDVDTYLELMKATPEYFESVAQFEKAKAEAGLFMSDHMADEVIEQCNAFMEMKENNYLISTFVERIKGLDELSEQEMSDYIQKNAFMLETYVLPSYSKLVATIQELKGSGQNELGVCGFAGGKEYYSQVVKSSVGTKRSVEEIQQLIRQQMLNDLDAMERVLKQTSKEEVYDTVEIMSSAVYAQETAAMEETNPVMILNTLEEKIGNAFPEVTETALSVKYVPEQMEAHMSPAFYMIPAIDNYEENVIYVNQAQMGNTLTLFTTLAHEGYPGHLYQTMYFAETNPDPVRSIFNFGGYVEGWATYAEMCSYYLTALEKKEASLMQKYSSVMLGVYTLADIGIHYEGWTREDTKLFFGNYGIKDTETVDHIYDLILGCPGNYLKYYVGYVEFLELKKMWMQEKGDTFSQKEFHEAVLEVGPAPFEIVEKYMWK